MGYRRNALITVNNATNATVALIQEKLEIQNIVVKRKNISNLMDKNYSDQTLNDW